MKIDLEILYRVRLSSEKIHEIIRLQSREDEEHKREMNRIYQRNHRARKGLSSDTPDTPDIVQSPKALLFAEGRVILSSLGVARDRIGGFIGNWLKKYDPATILKAIEIARDHDVADPIPYVTAILTKGNGSGHGRHKQTLSDIAFDLADEIEARELAEGIGGQNNAVRGR